MALIAVGGPRRFTALLAELLRPRVKPVAIQAVTTHDEPTSPKHHYPARRDRAIESAAMGREMFRL